MPKVKLKRVDIPSDGYHFLVKARLHEEKVWYVLDTGASRTTLDTERVRSAWPGLLITEAVETSSGIGQDPLKSFKAILPEFRVGDFVLHDYEVALLDLSAVHDTYRLLGLPEVAGILGSDVLVKGRAEIRLDQCEMKLHKHKK